MQSSCKIDIFNVGHGACNAITLPNGKTVLIDCGSRSETPYWWPSVHFLGRTIDLLVLTNLDEDHVSDFSDLLRNATVRTVWINDSINALRLRAMKPQGMHRGVESVHDYLVQPICLNLAFDVEPLKVTIFRHRYGVRFTDTNNLSLLTFVEYGNFCMVFPGDLEEEAWKAFLPNPYIQNLLRRTQLFIGSHHGRTNGCCEDVFAYCRPNAFILSDKEIVHDTQQTGNWYRQYARGLPKILSSPFEMPETRYVFTTRRDDCMTVDVDLSGAYTLWLQSNRQQPLPLVDLLASGGPARSRGW